jgi:hypothetical protein
MGTILTRHPWWREGMMRLPEIVFLLPHHQVILLLESVILSFNEMRGVKNLPSKCRHERVRRGLLHKNWWSPCVDYMMLIKINCWVRIQQTSDLFCTGTKFKLNLNELPLFEAWHMQMTQRRRTPQTPIPLETGVMCKWVDCFFCNCSHAHE